MKRVDLWLPAHEQMLAKLWSENVPMAEIAHRMNRSKGSVEARRYLNDFPKRAKPTPNSIVWTIARRAEFQRMWAEKAPVTVIAEVLNITAAKVHGQAKRVIETKAEARLLWSKADDATLTEMWAAGVSVPDLAGLLGRSTRGIKCRRATLNLPKRRVPGAVPEIAAVLPEAPKLVFVQKPFVAVATPGIRDWSEMPVTSGVAPKPAFVTRHCLACEVPFQAAGRFQRLCKLHREAA